jgi:sensor histidine kinase YesM
MVPELLNKTGKKFLIAVPYNAVFCTIIAILLSILEFAPKGKEISFVDNFVFSQCIGGFCCLFSIGAHNAFKDRKVLLIAAFGVALGLGTIFGELLGSVILWINPLIFIREVGFFFKILFGATLFGSVIIYFWHTREKIIETKTMAQDERIKRLTSEKEMIETNLKLLQAQIEPHFLFNTLSNILSLLDRDPEKGKSMLADLTRYLRTSLSKTRKDVSTIGQEMALIEDYLRIFKVRMGDRLRYEIMVSNDLNDAPLPPMLIQPLVENAIKHGLEPKVGGGEILIRADQNEGILRVEVADTGLGLQDHEASGNGLTNIQQRLHSLFGDQGRLTLEENLPHGFKAVIEVPYESDQCHYRR